MIRLQIEILLDDLPFGQTKYPTGAHLEQSVYDAYSEIKKTLITKEVASRVILGVQLDQWH